MKTENALPSFKNCTISYEPIEQMCQFWLWVFGFNYFSVCFFSSAILVKKKTANGFRRQVRNSQSSIINDESQSFTNKIILTKLAKFILAIMFILVVSCIEL